MSYARMQNAAGKFVAAERESFQAAAASADWANAKDFYLVITNAPGDEPSRSPRPTSSSCTRARRTPRTRKATLAFFDWALHERRRAGREAGLRAAAAGAGHPDRGLLGANSSTDQNDVPGTRIRPDARCRASKPLAMNNVQANASQMSTEATLAAPRDPQRQARHADRPAVPQRGFRRGLVGADRADRRRHLDVLGRPRWPSSTFGWQFLTTERTGTSVQQVRRAGADLRHPGHRRASRC